MKTAYEHKDGEIIYTPTGDKVATWDGETLRSARGFADEHKDSVQAWLDANHPTESNAVIDKPGVETPAARSLTPPKPIGAIEAGDKDPRVVAWIDAHGSPEDKANVKRWREAGLPL